MSSSKTPLLEIPNGKELDALSTIINSDIEEQPYIKSILPWIDYCLLYTPCWIPANRNKWIGYLIITISILICVYINICSTIIAIQWDVLVKASIEWTIIDILIQISPALILCARFKFYHSDFQFIWHYTNIDHYYTDYLQNNHRINYIKKRTIIQFVTLVLVQIINATVMPRMVWIFIDEIDFNDNKLNKFLISPGLFKMVFIINSMLMAIPHVLMNMTVYYYLDDAKQRLNQFTHEFALLWNTDNDNENNYRLNKKYDMIDKYLLLYEQLSPRNKIFQVWQSLCFFYLFIMLWVTTSLYLYIFSYQVSDTRSVKYWWDSFLIGSLIGMITSIFTVLFIVYPGIKWSHSFDELRLMVNTKWNESLNINIQQQKLDLLSNHIAEKQKNEKLDKYVALDFNVLTQFQSIIDDKPLYYNFFGFIMNRSNIQRVCAVFVASKLASILFQSVTNVKDD